MLGTETILFFSFGYIGLLFAIAYVGDKHAEIGKSKGAESTMSADVQIELLVMIVAIGTLVNILFALKIFRKGD